MSVKRTLLMLLFVPFAWAQGQLVSPGKLSNAHESLEGMGSCTKCHNFGDKTFRQNCLSCHGEIKSRIDRNLGYHSFTRKLECSSCHKEHHGRDFKLIRWDPAKFDHKQAGFVLEGKHAGKECRQCHQPKNIIQKEILKKSDAAKKRTFLGLEPECGTCHEDEHRGQLGKDCARCHNAEDWKKNTFSHAKARFPLAGKHADVGCRKCHSEEKDGKVINGDGAFLKFRVAAFGQCSDCHEDKHKGAFGKDCADCHTPADWKAVKISRANFDHSKTKYPLTGKHGALQCSACHGTGDFKKFAGKDLASCLTCHKDFHQGQFAKHSDRGDCRRCHTVDGFKPSHYEASEHVDARFQLSGAHGATACDRCHIETTINGKKTQCFSWESFACTTCHADFHAGQFDAKMKERGCLTCHTDKSWHSMEFDHAGTSFPLRGKHLTTACDRCHTQGTVNGKQTTIYKIADTRCAACHADEHQGQFKDAAGVTACERCHTSGAWKPAIFDHVTMSRFPLTGKHATVACASCHKRETIDAGKPATMRYKPLAPACAGCHAGK
ncbi:MAG: cytochrome C [Ignavibacteria bacterium]|nr:cytochrome C [Ignavibacteria bacterium]